MQVKKKLTKNISNILGSICGGIVFAFVNVLMTLTRVRIIAAGSTGAAVVVDFVVVDVVVPAVVGWLLLAAVSVVGGADVVV